jgi:hypothetical protein
MSNLNNQISEEFAKQLLKSLYKLDMPIGLLDSIASKLKDDKDKELISEAIAGIMSITLSELMVPIYHLHPSLGRASEPGEWISEDENV